MGLLDMLSGISPEQNQGLLAAAAQILQNSGPSRQPYSLGQAVGTGIETYQGTMERNRVRALEEQRQAQNDAFNQEYRTAQMGSIKAQQEDRQAKIKFDAAKQDAIRKSIGADGQIDMKALVTNLAPFDPEGAAEIAKQLAPKPVTYGQPQEVVVKGKPALAVFDNQGNPKVLDGFSPYQAPRQSSGGGAARGSIEAAAGKPLPTQALKMLVSEEDALNTASGIQQDLARARAQIDSGKLDFGPVSNLKNQALNIVGASTESSRNFASFRATLEKLRNDSLRLNAGVQTDGDAQRAWNELFANITDKEYVKQRLSEIEQINARAIRQRQMNIGTINSNYGRNEPKPADTVTTIPNPVQANGKVRKYNPATGRIE